MEIEVTVDYNTPAEVFDQLSNAYPLGEYVSGVNAEHIKWFRLKIRNSDGKKIVLTWFKKW